MCGKALYVHNIMYMYNVQGFLKLRKSCSHAFLEAVVKMATQSRSSSRSGKWLVGREPLHGTVYLNECLTPFLFIISPPLPSSLLHVPPLSPPLSHGTVNETNVRTLFATPSKARPQFCSYV